jgi:hypothetical protein
MTNKNNKFNYRPNATSIKNATPEDLKSIELMEYRDQALATFHVVDNSPLSHALKRTTATQEQLSFFAPDPPNTSKLDSGEFIITDPNIDEIRIDPQDEIILRGVSNLYEKEIEDKNIVRCRISSLIREAYGYAAKQKIRDKEYKDFMQRLDKLSAIRVKIQFAEEGSGIIDAETNHIMNSIRRPIVEFIELTSEGEPSSKDWIIFKSKPIMYDYSKHKKYIEHVPKTVLQAPKGVVNNSNFRVLVTELYRRINQYKRALNGKGKIKYIDNMQKINYNKLFEECDMKNITPTQKTRHKKTINLIMNKFVNDDRIIKDYFEYDSNGTTQGRPVGIKFLLNEE